MRKLFLTATLLILAPLTYAADDLDLDKYSGKVVMLDFWASWCVPCRRSFPWMNEMQEKYGQDGLVIVAVNVDREVEDAAAFLQEYPANFEIIYGPDAELAKKYEIEVMPSSFIIDREGKIVDRHLGFKVKKQEEYEAMIRAALESPIENGLEQ
jgi:cytochrome c biogenesis protein CcmG/thiol:disulfide interchange protein DsbE